MTLYFAYGSNMSRPMMAVRCPTAAAVGAGVLSGWEWLIVGNGYASVRRRPGATVYGVLWRLQPRDQAALDVYESIGGGLYRRQRLPVRHGEGCVNALVYVAANQRPGRPQPGYLNLVLSAGEDWALPEDYLATLSRAAPSAWQGMRRREQGEIA